MEVSALFLKDFRDGIVLAQPKRRGAMCEKNAN
jgi:hypothetical protein